jgi:UDP-glucose 4-epimerase
MKIFITGIAGFLGSHLAEALIALGHDVLGLDDMSGGDYENLPSGIRVWTPVGCKRIGSISLLHCDVLVHCAALPHEGLSVFSPATITDSIYGASVSVFSAAIAAGVRRIVNLSSMSRYGNIPAPFHETDDPRPVDPYGIAKLAAERTLECLARIHGIEYVVAIPHSIYGPRQRRSDPYRNVIAIMMNRILQGKTPVIYGTGKQQRCFSYIDDVIPCLVQMAVSEDKEILGRAINVGPDHGAVSVLELCRMVCEEMWWEKPPIFYPGRPAEVEVANCSGKLSRDLLGYHPKTSLRDGIRRMAQWVKSVGPKPFDYHLPIEITTNKTPRTWTNREI